MVVTCERCETRFQLDEARIPSGGARVRCSRCKHAFQVHPPDATVDDVALTAAFDADQAGASQAPPPSRDLSEGDDGPDPFGETASEGLEEQDWEFNEEKPAAPAPRPRPRRAELEIDRPAPAAAEPAAPPVRPPTPAPATPSLDELGSPEEWDFLALDASSGGAAASGPTPARAAAAADALGAEEPARDEAPATARRPAPVASEARPWQRLAEPLRSGLPDLLGTLGVLALLGLGLARVASPAEPPAAVAAPLHFELPAGQVSDVRVSLLENGFAGRIPVVSGRFEPSAGAPPQELRVELLDASGNPIPEASALAGPALHETALRGESPALLRERLESAAESGGSTALDGRFVAILGELPERAAGLRVTATPLPPTASFPPEPLPSSE